MLMYRSAATIEFSRRLSTDEAQYLKMSQLTELCVDAISSEEFCPENNIQLI